MYFDLTIFEDDEKTPFFGRAEVDDVTGEIGDLVEADFSTDPTHPRPYLREVKNWSATEINFVEASATIGALTLEVLDKRLTREDQDTGILTSRLHELNGRVALLRRLDPDTGEMRSAFLGVVYSYRVEPSLVVLSITLRDIRQREKQPLFASNFAIFGKDGKTGPAVNYGELPVSFLRRLFGVQPSYMIKALEPYTTQGQHFVKLSADEPADGIHWGYVIYHDRKATDPFNLIQLDDLNSPTQGADGLWRYNGFQLRWRYNSEDAWTYVTPHMVRAVNYPAAVDGKQTVNVKEVVTGKLDPWSLFPRLYVGSDDPGRLPTEHTPIQMQILAVEISEDTPFFWDNGTLGTLLREIYDGVHSQGSPAIPYNEEAMAAFEATTPRARLVLTEPVKDMREFVEKHIYAAAGYVPGMDTDGKVMPVNAWALPTDLTAVPIIYPESITQIGDWEHGDENVVNHVVYTYLRESIADQKVEIVRKHRRFWPDKNVKVTGTLSEWERYFTRPVIRDALDVESMLTFGDKKLEITPLTIRSFGDAQGRSRSPETADEAGHQIAESISKHVMKRFKRGAPTYRARVRATDPSVKDLILGGWVRCHPTWMPQYADTSDFVQVDTEGAGSEVQALQGNTRRGARRYMQIKSISDEDPITRELVLVDGGLPDFASDPDVVEQDPAQQDCLLPSESVVGGLAVPLPTGHLGFKFEGPGPHSITNGCPGDMTLPAILLIAGGGAGGAGPAGGGGGAGGVADGFTNALFRNVLIKAGVTAEITVGAGGNDPNENGEDTVLWLRRVSTGTPGEEAGTALTPGVDNPDLGYRAVGGGHGGGNDGTGGGGGSGGGSGGWLPISGGDFNGGGTIAVIGQGNPGGGGAGGGGIATCQHAYGGGGGSYGGAGRTGRNNEGCGEGGEGGPMTRLRYWGVRAGAGGVGAAQSVPQALGDLCCSNSVPGATQTGGYGYGGGGSTDGGGSAPGGPGVAIIAFKGSGIPMLFAPVITSEGFTDRGTYQVCIEEEDWPIVEPPDYKVRVEYSLSAPANEEEGTNALFVDNMVRPKPYVTGGYVPQDVSPLNDSSTSKCDGAQPATVHRDHVDKWVEMYSTRFDVDGGPYGSKMRSAPCGRIPQQGSSRDDYIAAGGTLPPGMPAAFYGGLIRPDVVLPSEGYVFDIKMEGGGFGGPRVFVLFNFNPTTGNGYGVEVMNEGYARTVYRIVGWTPGALPVVEGPSGQLGFGLATWRAEIRDGLQRFSQNGKVVEYNLTEFGPSNGGLYIWSADGFWRAVGFGAGRHGQAHYLLSKLQVYTLAAADAGATQPAEQSGNWLLAGTLEAPGCVETPQLPNGSKVWVRAIAEGAQYPPSVATEAGIDYDGYSGGGIDVPPKAVLLESGVTVDPDTKIATVTWDPDVYAGIVRIRGQIHTESEALLDPLPHIADVPAAQGSYVLPGVVEEGFVYTVDLQSWGGVADPPGNVPLVQDNFDRPNSSDVNANAPASAGEWTHPDANSPGILSNKMRLSEFGTHYVWNLAVNRGEMFVQATVDHGGERETGIIARFVRNASNDRDAYQFIADVDTPGYRLEKTDGDVFATLDAEAEPAVDNGTSVMQLYVKDGVQEAWGSLGGGHSLSAADTTFDGVTGSAGIRYGADSSEGARTYDDFLCMRNKYARVAGLPSGWKAKILNDADVVVAQATAVAGVATLDCSRFGGCTENVPYNGWAKLIVTDGADVQQGVMEETGTPIRVFPGVDITFSPDLGLTGPLEDEGESYRTQAETEVPDTTTPADVDEAVQEGLEVLDKLVFDDDLNLVVDNDLKLITHD